MTKLKNTLNSLKLNNMLFNNEWVNNEFNEEIEKFLEQMKMNTQQSKTYETQQSPS